MSRAKWSTSPVATPASTARCLRLAATEAMNTATVDSEMRDWALGLVSQQPGVQRHVIHIDVDRCDERRDIEAARRVDEARQDEQAQSHGGQIGDSGLSSACAAAAVRIYSGDDGESLMRTA
jgi:hypothetical protein